METIPFTNAIEFLEHFHPYKEQWKYGGTIFRGQQDSSWEVIPKLFRAPYPKSTLHEIIHKFDLSFHRKIESRSESSGYATGIAEVWARTMRMANFERYLLHLFVKQTNRHGFEVPGSETLLNINKVFHTDFKRVYLLSEFSNGIELDQFNVPQPDQPIQLTGLAQHHGLPTRLLDFTESPYAALFFASEYNKNEENEEICVYSTQLSYYKKDVYKSGSHSIANFDRISALYGVMRMPNSRNDYLSKQEGVFLYPIFPFDFYKKQGRYPNLDDHARIFSYDDEVRGYSVRKHTLPGSKKPALREALAQMGYTKAYFMPTLDNVVKDIEYHLATDSSFNV